MAHEWYERYRKEVATALNRGKTVAPEEAVSCTVMKMGDGSFLLCAHVSGPKVEAMVKDAKRNGGKPFSAGTLYKGDKGVTFAVAEGNPAVKKQFADAAAAAAGKPVFVNVIEATTASPDAEIFKERMKAILPKVEQAGQKAPDRKAALEKLTAAANDAARANDFAQALAVAGKLEAAAGMILGAPTAPPPPPPPAPPKAPPQPQKETSGLALEFKDRMKGIIPRYQQAAKQAPDRKAELDKLASQAGGAARAGDFSAAFKFADQLNEVSTQILAAPPAPSEAPMAPAVTADDFKSRVKEVLPLYKEAAQKAPDRKDELTKLAQQATAAGQSEKFAEAMDLLDQLEARSRSAIRAAGAKQEVESAAGKGNVVFRKWRAEKATAGNALRSLQKAILADEDSAANEPEWDNIKKEAARLDEVIDVFSRLDKDLEPALEAVYSAAPVEREKARARALAIVEEYRQTLRGEPLYAELDNGVYGPIKVAGVIAEGLDNLAAALA